jgi:hypothetical protein
MHDNAIRDLALACWSVLLSPIKRAAILTNLAYGESVCLVRRAVVDATAVHRSWLTVIEH